MKKLFLIFGLVFILAGCSNQVEIGIDEDVEDNKLAYLDIKDNLTNQEDFSNLEDIPCNITASVDRINEEEISYRIIIDDPKVNMYDVEALLIHNNFTEDIFPSIGILDETESLLVDGQDVKGISLVGYIETTKEISEVDLELRLWLKYIDEEGLDHEFYYKVDDFSTNIDNN